MSGRPDQRASTPALAEGLADWAVQAGAGGVPDAVRRVAGRSLLDVAGLCVGARLTDYVQAVARASDGRGDCTAFGHAPGYDAAGAATINGTAAHGEDFDDTFEGTPVHPGAVAVPAVLAACEAHDRSGADALAGIAVAAELMCRVALAAPTANHKAGFHPTAVIGTLGAAAGVGAALGLSAPQVVNALGIAGSMASGIIEYLAEGAWTKRLHPGWAAQSGYRAARLAAEGFLGPRTVFEGTHGFFFAFGSPEIVPDFASLTDGLGTVWRMTDIAYKPFACGTMCQPFVDAAIRLAGTGIAPADIAAVDCAVGQATVHRLWEPRAEKVRPTTPYSAKFSTPYCVAVAFHDKLAGPRQFDAGRIADESVLALAAKVSYTVDPDDEYPENYSGRMRVTLNDGTEHRAVQPHLRGGRRQPLSDDELAAKFFRNAADGGWAEARADALRAYLETLFDRDDVTGLREFRGP